MICLNGGETTMLIIHDVGEIYNEGFKIDKYIEQMVVDALNANYVVFINNKKQLIAKNDDIDEERILAVFG